MKKRADNGIDYTPRNGMAPARPLERHVHGVVQRSQHYPIFEVTAAGKCVEWTDNRNAAHSAFADADALPKHLNLVLEDGRRVVLDMVSATGRRLAQPEAQRLAA